MKQTKQFDTEHLLTWQHSPNIMFWLALQIVTMHRIMTVTKKGGEDSLVYINYLPCVVPPFLPATGSGVCSDQHYQWLISTDPSLWQRYTLNCSKWTEGILVSNSFQGYNGDYTSHITVKFFKNKNKTKRGGGGGGGLRNWYPSYCF